jgi:S1-C subfamily serine protease
MDDAYVQAGGWCTALPVGAQIVAIDGQRVRSVADITELLRAGAPGQAVECAFRPPSIRGLLASLPVPSPPPRARADHSVATRPR